MQGSGCRVQDQGSGLVQGAGCRVQGYQDAFKARDEKAAALSRLCRPAIRTVGYDLFIKVNSSGGNQLQYPMHNTRGHATPHNLGETKSL